MLFDDIWTKEKNRLLRQFNREGKDIDFIYAYFGDDLYHIGRRTHSRILPYQLFNIKEEIEIHPDKTTSSINMMKSLLDLSKTDYILNFKCKDKEYIILLMYVKLNNTETYNVIFTTKSQYQDYLIKLDYYKQKSKGNINKTQHMILSKIIEKETNYNELFPLFKSLVYILQHFYNSMLHHEILSVGDTDIKIKIRLYRNIISSTFKNATEFIETVKDSDGEEHIYYCYKL